MILTALWGRYVVIPILLMRKLRNLLKILWLAERQDLKFCRMAPDTKTTALYTSMLCAFLHTQSNVIFLLFSSTLRLLTLWQTPLYPYCSLYFCLCKRKSPGALPFNGSQNCPHFLKTELNCQDRPVFSTVTSTICWLEYFFYLPTFHSITATLHCDSHSSF